MMLRATRERVGSLAHSRGLSPWFWLLVDEWNTLNGIGWLFWPLLLSRVNVNFNVIHAAFVVVLLIGLYGWYVVRRARLLVLLVKLA
ncbi:hypothetical protein [Ktedonobacter sp. SOSP1-52]|uniref:hypothetical protein n=1 Tax=Ktedonobacter sp. SOSP1-52 TaxID=2778366 RepID=UPI001F32C644|nr:hypothetical protein [Ktedonobacter sp. SOSP1-52]